MANFITDVYGQVGSIWKKLSIGQKIVIVVVGCAMAAGITGVVYWSSRLEMGVLYGNVSPEDAAAIQATLEEQAIPYELRGGGTTIAVPRNKVYEVRNQLALQGLPRGDGRGFEIFDTMQLGMTEFLQEVNLTRALEGELARTITWMSQVAAAKVHITRPKPTIFTELETPPTAVVVLKLIPGRTLGQREVAGISHIVASAVEGLDHENVRVVDDKSRLLSKPADAFEEQLATGQMELKHGLETAMTRKVQNQLDEVVGPSKVRVMVNLDLDFEKRVEKATKYSQPLDGKIVLTEEMDIQDTSKTLPTEGGVPGAANASAQNPIPATGEETSTTDGTKREYAVDKTDSDTVHGGAVIKRLSFAIMIDKTLEAQKADIEGIVKESVGYDENRGDTFTSAVIEFSVPEIPDETEALESYEQKEFILTLIRYAVQGLSVVAVLLVLWIILKKAERKVARTREAAPEGLTLSKEREEVERKKIREDVLSAVQADPVMASQILHEWLEEEESE